MTTDSSTGDWTPKRIEEARGRCERATPGPWSTYDGGWREHSRAAVNPWRFMHVIVPLNGPPKYPGHVASKFVAELKDAQDAGAARAEADAAFIAHAREDLPAAIAEIKRLTAERAELRTIRDGAVRGLKDRIAALEAELAARAPADASLEARAEALGKAISEAFGPVVAPPQFWRDTCIALVRAVDASRPGLTEEQAEDWAEDIWQEVDGEPCDDPAGIVASALLRASRGKDGPASAKEMPSVKPCPAFFGLAGSVYGAQPGDRCDACKRTRAEHGASQ